MLRLLASALAASVLVFALSEVAAAGGAIIVGDGTAVSCTEDALASALLVAEVSGGGNIRFKCGKGLVTIIVTDFLLVPHNTTIDGGGVITLEDGTRGIIAAILAVDEGAEVTLRDLGFAHGRGVANAGILTIANSTFVGGASAPCGGALRSGGTLTIRNSTFTGAVAFISGGSLCLSGSTTIHNSTFSSNSSGGGTGRAGAGGAIRNFGDLTITDSDFIANSSFEAPGGAIANSGALTVLNSSFTLNRGGEGGAIFNFGGTVTIRKTLISGNSAPNPDSSGQPTAGIAGGIYNEGGDVTIHNSIITGNSASTDAGGIYTCCGGTTTLKNAVVTENTPNNIVNVP